ncbi:hypothetical protein [Clostridium tunisiense]|uniref:hypothetical protein n=1 Tax=Clostridium tunisiense TaxID=219748 RepID=UPI0003189C6E|nr:hypothetical protein [Clostridium tunisiense]
MLKNKALIISTIILGIGVTITGCGNKGSVDETKAKASEAYVNIIKENKKDVGFHAELSHWGLKLSSGEKFEWTKDTAANEIDFAMVIPADTFTKAGVDVNKIDAKELVFKPAASEGGMETPNLLVRPYDLSDKKQNSNGAEDAFKRLLKFDQVPVSYDSAAKNYVLNLGDGYKVHWTEELGQNPSDIIFTIKAEPLIQAGLDVGKISKEGWKYNKDSNTLTKEFKL